jgi:hypothetical protein
VLTEDEIAILSTAGATAPSGGNEQPWQVIVEGERLLIRPDPDRSNNSFLDVEGYAAYFAIGAFAENVALTAPGLGLEYSEKIYAGTVTFTFTGRRDPVPQRLAESIPRRLTNRQPGDGTALTPAELDPLPAAVGPGFLVTPVSDSKQKTTIGKALGAADVLRMRNPTMFDDMVREMCWTERETEHRRDGLDLRTLELPGATIKLLSVLRRIRGLRRILPAAKLAETAELLVKNSSHICCLSTREPLTPDTMVLAGRSLQRLWLAATQAGVALHPWTVAPLLLIRLETFHGKGFTDHEQRAVASFGASLREGFELLPADRPVFVFRLSKPAAPATARSLRRPWPSFTTIQESADDQR